MPDASPETNLRDKAPNPNEKLIRVFDTDQEPEALVVHGLLESAGIESDITALEAPRSPQEYESEETDVSAEPANEG